MSYTLAEASEILGNHMAGIYVSGDSSEAVLSQVAIRDTHTGGDGILGHGLDVQSGATLTATSCVVERNVEHGILATGAGTDVALSNVVVRETQPAADGRFGRGIGVHSGASLLAESCLVEENHDTGLMLAHQGRFQLTDVTVRDTWPRERGEHAKGIWIEAGALATLTSCTLERNHDVGLYVAGGGTHVDIRASTIADTQARPDGEYGMGIVVLDGAALVSQTSDIDGNGTAGVLVQGAGTTASFSADSIRGSYRTSSYSIALGLAVQEEASVVANGVRVEQVDGTGLFVTSEADLRCEDCVLQANVFTSARVGEGARLELSQVDVLDTAPDEVIGGGVGVYAVSDVAHSSQLLVEGAWIEGHPLAGVWLDGPGWYVVRDSVIVGGEELTGGESAGAGGRTYGDGLVASGGVSRYTGGEGLLIQSTEIQDAARAGLLLDRSSAVILDGSYHGNLVDLVWQDCEGVSAPVGVEDIPVVEWCPETPYPLEAPGSP